MKLEVGMYVRTKKGIYKINDFIKNNYTQKFTYIDNCGCSEFLEEKQVIKASHNIIDLIEKNDLVEIEYHSPRYEERITRLFEVDYRHKNNITFGNMHCQLNIFDGEWDEHDQLLEPVIKSIVTKEQVEQMEYKISLEG